ncbi:MAG: hypothetical protein AAFQ40_06365 [Cyanobacteria bacterium J06623_5]
MISNSRSVTTSLSLGSASYQSTSAADSYSNGLMDDLFGDVDRILDGDLSACMTVVKPRRTANSTTTRTVQLPSDFSPRSARDIYNATVNATPAASGYETNPPINPPVYRQPTPIQGTHVRRQTGYSNGGRPVTSFQTASGQSSNHAGNYAGNFPGNFQSTVIQSAERASTATVDVDPIQPIAHSLYPKQSSAEWSAGKATGNGSPRPPQTIFEPQNRHQSVSLPFLLMGAAGISVASTLGLWAVSQSATGGWSLALSTEATAAEIPNTDQEFLGYLQRSLETITAKQAAQHNLAVIPVVAPATAPVPTTVPNVNPAAAPGALPNLPGAATATNIIERVFVPVYQNQQQNNSVAAASQPAKLPQVAVPQNSNRPTVPVPESVAAAAALPSGAPAAATPSVPIVPASNSTALPNLPSGVTTAVAPTNSAAEALTDVTPSSELVLVGILNLGSRSAALFDIDGSSQRAYVGDRIGLSDWNLVSVNGQDVVIRRNGEVRSVYIGQRF